MNENQKFRAELLAKMSNDIELAKKAYEFIMVEPQIASALLITAFDGETEGLKDGVYIAYTDGHVELFDGSNSKEGAANVMAVLGQLRVKLFHSDIEEVTLETDEESGNYVKTYDDAVEDFDGEAHTKQLIERGLSCELPEGYYIPSIGQLYLMYALKKKINDALTYIGHEVLQDDYYWSSTEYSAAYAWGLTFSGGYFYHGNGKRNACRVRPVCAC